MIYFLSEVWPPSKETEEFFDRLFQKAKPRTLFLYIDNDYSESSNWFDALVGKYNLQTLKADSCTIGLEANEEKNDLGRYFTKFGTVSQGHPKITAKVAYRVCRKPEG